MKWFESLDPRRLFAAELVGAVNYESGFYGAGDRVAIDATLKQSVDGGGQTGVSILFAVLLSKDKTLGNADDVLLASGVFLKAAGAGVMTQSMVGAIGEAPVAGSYYTAVKVQDPASPTASVSWSAGRDTTLIAAPLNATVVGDTLVAGGTSKNDRVTVRENSASVIVTINGKSSAIRRLAVPGGGLVFNLGGGNDALACYGGHGVTARLTVNGGKGDDTIVGGLADDRLDGGGGNDKLAGAAGSDTLIGGAGNDALDGLSLIHI